VVYNELPDAFGVPVSLYGGPKPAIAIPSVRHSKKLVVVFLGLQSLRDGGLALIINLCEILAYRVSLERRYART
jgi:hypothetical protein